jgi:predicted small lipoprotein YifL
VIVRSTRAFYRLAAVVTLVAALALSACGRKGPLDLPPGAASEQSGAAAANVAPAQQPTLFGNAMGRDTSAPVAPKGPDKRIPLDALLD